MSIVKGRRGHKMKGEDIEPNTTADPDGMGRKPYLYTLLEYNVVARLSAHTDWICGTVREGIFNGFLEFFWIFLKNEHDKPIGTPYSKTNDKTDRFYFRYLFYSRDNEQISSIYLEQLSIYSSHIECM